MKRLERIKTFSDGIEIWLLEFDSDSTLLAEDWSILSADEQLRAQHFHLQRDQSRFVITRAALRRLLAKHVRSEPQALIFKTGNFGKPYLKNFSEIKFNISHAGSFALIGLSAYGEIGVDIEHCHRDMTNLDKYLLSPVERGWNLWPSKYFVDLWVVKESVLKALGYGISEHLQTVTVLPNGDGSYCITLNHADWTNVSAWSIDVPQRYLAAFALGSQFEKCSHVAHYCSG